MNESNGTTSQSMKIRLGEQLRHNKLAILLSILLVILIGKVELFATLLNFEGNQRFLAFVGNPLSLLAIWGLWWLKGSGWSDLGIKRPTSWKKTIALGIGVAFLVQSTAPIVFFLSDRLGFGLPNYDAYSEVSNSTLALLRYIVVAWTTAAFAEEVIWRGFLIPQIAKLFDEDKIGWMIGLVVSCILFGLIHYRQGFPGMVGTGIAGLAYGILFLRQDRNLWASIIAHGVTGTISFLLLAFIA